MGKFLIVSGDDDFARKQHARQSACMLCNCDDPENAEVIEIIPGDLPELKPDAIAERFLEALRTPPFLSPEKVIWMRHHPDLDSFAAENAHPVVKELVQFLTEPLPDEVSVIIDGPGVDKRKNIWKTIQKNGAEIISLSTAKTTDKNFSENRRTLLNEFAAAAKKRISPDAVTYLTEVIGGDSGTLANELEKLICYTGNSPEITLADCRAIVSKSAEAVIWEYTDAIQNQRCADAMQCIAQLTKSNEQGLELKLIALVSNAFQKNLNLRLAMAQLGISRPSPAAFERISAEKKAEFPSNPLIKLHPYRAFKMCEAAMRYDGAAIAQKLTAIRDANCALVSGRGVPEIILEQLTVKLCS